MFKKLIFIIAAIVEIYGISFTAMAESYYKVRLHDLSPPVTLSGTVIPKKSVTLSAQLPGRVDMIAGEEGDKFTKNTVLVALNNRELLAKRHSAIAAWQRADATLRNAGMQYSRELYSPDSPSKAPGGMGLPNLFDQIITKPLSGLITQSEDGLDRRAQLHNFGSQVDQARSALSQAESQIEQIDSKLRDAKGLSPFDGIILKKWVEIGDTVQPGQRLLQFATEGLQIEVEVPARLVRGLKVNKQISTKLDVLEERVVATVAQIFPIADAQRHTVKVKFDLPIDKNSEQGQYIGPGQYAQVEVPDIKAYQQKLLLIPKNAVVRGGSLPRVCVWKDNNKYELRLIRLGRIINPTLISDLDPTIGDYITVLSGLQAGDQVVIYRNSEKSPC